MSVILFLLFLAVLYCVFMAVIEFYLSPEAIHRQVMKEMDRDYGDDPLYQRWKAEINSDKEGRLL